VKHEEVLMKTTEEIPAQSQDRKPGLESEMNPEPQYDRDDYWTNRRLLDKVALITGGDSGIGRSIAVLYAKEGAKVAIVYLDEQVDAEETKRLVEERGGQCLLIAGDIASENFCQEAVQKTVDEFGKLDILINNAAVQYSEDTQTLKDIDSARLGRVFATNVFSMFYFTKAALPHLKEGSSIINTTSINAYKGNEHLLSYTATKGAILSLTRSLAQSLIEKGIRVNAVAPGPIWTPLIVDTMEPDKVASFGRQVPMKRAGQPVEVATSYVFLASDDASYFSGQVLHPNGGVVVNA
jgi:NAD(P)-dependent dehydrogenase (short-subunit alcohol dehydrogenase family)